MWESSRKLLGPDISILEDDNLEGSKDELLISQEVFYDNVPAHKLEHYLDDGIENPEIKQRKVFQASFCSKIGKSFLRNEAAYEDSSIYDADDLSGLYQKTSESSCFTEGSTQIESNDHLAPAKRIKLSVDDLYNFKPFLDKSLAKSVPLKDIISGMHQPASTSSSRIFMCHVVELTGNGITSSCYLLNNDIEKDKGGNSVVGDAVTCNLATSGAIGGKGMGSEAIPSLVSQESIASKDLVSPAATASKEFGPPKCTNKKIKRGISVELDAIDVLLRSDCAQDSRLLLRNQIFHLLVDAGWSIEKRQRKCRSHAEFLYVSPQEKPFRELTKAWIFFGKNLLVHESVQMPAEYDMQWSDFGRFWSDLSNTLKHIEIEIKDREHKGSLAHRWTLLDPFVNVVFVERKLKALKAGNVVKANCSLAAADKKSAFTFGLKQSNVKTGRHASKKFPDYFMGPEGVPIDFGEQPGAGAVEGSTSKSIYVSEGDSMHHMQTASTNEKHYDVCLNGSSHLHPSSFPTFRSSITSIQSASSLYEVPISRANADVMCEGKTFSPHENNCRSSPSRNRKNSESGMDVAEYVAVGSFSGGVELSKRRVCDQREQLLVSMNDCLNHVDVALLQSSELNKFLHESETMLPEVVLSEMIQQSRVRTEELMENGVHSTANANVKKKMHKRSKSASAIKVVQHEYPHMPSYRVRTGIKELIPQSSQLRSAAFQECFTDDAQNPDSCRDVLTVSFQRPIGQRKSECPSLLQGGDHDSDCLKDVHPRNHTDEISGGACVGLSASKSDMKNTSRGRSIACRLKDDDLLISAIIQSSGGKQSKPRAGTTKSKCFKKRKIRKGRCRLLPRSLGKGGKHFADDRWTSMFERTVLSWLINAGVISVNEVIQYQDLKNNEVVKDGVLARNGVLCKCCSKVFSLSNFKMHAGFDLKRPCLNLFMESSKPFTLCQLQAWSAEYKARKSSTRTAQINEFDQNDDSCGLCGEGGELLCCDNCPSTFHQSCLLAEELPEGSWYCSNCTCWICGNLVSDEDVFTSNGSLKCSQCDHKYHEVCLRYNGANEIGSSPWFCSKGCEQVYSGLQSCVGLPNFLSDEFSWTLLKSIHDDAKNHSAQRLALKAECNSKLAVALTIMEECFLSMVDPRTGIDMIPHVVYNWGSTFARLNYQRFYTAVLEKNDVLMCVASIRVHGTALAEMPLIATCSKYRRQGLCRCLLSAIEKLLITIKVEKLVIAALPELVETWTVGFGFIPMGEDEKKSLNKVNLMVLPGTVMLKKPLYIDQASDLSEGSADELSCKSYKSVEEGPTLVGNRCRELKCENEESCFIKEDAGDFELQAIYCRASEAVEDQKMKADVLQLTPSSCLGSQGNGTKHTEGMCPMLESDINCSSTQLGANNEISETGVCMQGKVGTSLGSEAPENEDVDGNQREGISILSSSVFVSESGLAVSERVSNVTGQLYKRETEDQITYRQVQEHEEVRKALNCVNFHSGEIDSKSEADSGPTKPVIERDGEETEHNGIQQNLCAKRDGITNLPFEHQKEAGGASLRNAVA